MPWESKRAKRLILRAFRRSSARTSGCGAERGATVRTSRRGGESGSMAGCGAEPAFTPRSCRPIAERLGALLSCDSLNGRAGDRRAGDRPHSKTARRNLEQRRPGAEARQALDVNDHVAEFNRPERRDPAVAGKEEAKTKVRFVSGFRGAGRKAPCQRPQVGARAAGRPARRSVSPHCKAAGRPVAPTGPRATTFEKRPLHEQRLARKSARRLRGIVRLRLRADSVLTLVVIERRWSPGKNPHCPCGSRSVPSVPGPRR